MKNLIYYVKSLTCFIGSKMKSWLTVHGVVIMATLAGIIMMHKMYAQETESYYEKMKVILSDLDTSNFKNGILYERVIPWANLRAFTAPSGDTTNFNHFKQAMYELYLASNKKYFFTSEFLQQLKWNYEKKEKFQLE